MLTRQMKERADQVALRDAEHPQGITYREADCYYNGKKRNAYRVVYSSEGRVWYTEDHYNTFTELFPTVP